MSYIVSQKFSENKFWFFRMKKYILFENNLNLKYMEKTQFVELPSKEVIIKDLTPQQQLIYLGIRSFMNKDSYEAFPSVETIAERIGASAPTVRKCIKVLEEKDYIKVDRSKKHHVYKFNKLKQFEPFSYEFLENKDLSFSQRALLVASQQYMKDKKSGIGKISYSKKELSEMINMPYSTLARLTKELENKEIISLVKAANNPQEMQFNFQKYGQQIVKVLVNHDRTLSLHNQVLMNHEERFKSLLERIEALENENKRLKNANQDIYI